MSIRFDYNGATTQAVGRSHGVTVKELEGLRKRAKGIHEDLMRRRRKKELGFYDLPFDDVLVRAIQEYARGLRWAENFVVLGIGGSALGPICLHTALAHNYHNLLPAAKRRGRPRLFVLDNSDPEIVTRLLDAVDLKKTVFNVVTKSGATPETMSQLVVAVELIRRKIGPKALKKHIVATTDVSKGLLRPFCDAHELASFVVPDNVGGRFSVFTAVGLLPAAVEGIAIHRLLAGARDMAKRCTRSDLMRNPAYLNAAIHYLLDTRRGKTMSVMMPYSNALRDVADWYRQLWAESLGKAHDVHGRKAYVGQTPIKALGATDQHSQVQLYVEGPNNKVFNLVQTERFRARCPIPKSFRDIPELAYLQGHDMGALINAELDATEFALAKAKRPTVRFVLDSITPENVGGLLYLLEVQTAFAGGLYEIDAFDQPGVEEGKKATAALMGRSKAADLAKAAEIASVWRKKKSLRSL
ncbi:glucose-6-phosphate isomerase [Candidatus Sumerlaeota bacterium]|nr:glucose-6-phosphate isomerase [Candidatus Sumerlaeota bacterium]